jgi:low temperature requirement protein LtrA
MAARLFIEAAIVLIAAFVPPALNGTVSMIAILTGLILTAVGQKNTPGRKIDFMHLTERAMLYVVFTFGEMIIVLSAYFDGDGGFDWNVIYFSLMGFLIVAGLFVSYELIYDHLLDREMEDNGVLYMTIHIFIVFALGCITVSLEFMQEEEVTLMPKVIFITAAIIAYYVFLFSTRRYAKKRCVISLPFMLMLAGAAAVFAVLMIALRDNMRLNIFVSMAYVWSTVAVLYRFSKEFELSEVHDDIRRGTEIE